MITNINNCRALYKIITHKMFYVLRKNNGRENKLIMVIGYNISVYRLCT